MINTRLFRLLVVAAMLVSLANRLEGRSHSTLQKARVRFLATSTVIRGTWGMNEDIFLAELRLNAKSDPILARLIDGYPNEYPPLSREILTSHLGTVFRVQRDRRCDLPYKAMKLRTAPGDPMAILPEKLSYEPKLSSVPASDAILRCYRMVR